MTRDWKTGNSIENTHHCWEDLILKDTFGITDEDWKSVIQQTVAHVRNWADLTITERVTCMVDLLLPQLQTLWQGKKNLCQEKDGKLLFRWLPCRSLKGATVADHALTASAIAYCLAYDEKPRPDGETLDRLRLSAMTATWIEDGLEDVHHALWGEDSPIEPKENGSDCERIVFLAKTAASKRDKINDVAQLNEHPLNQKRQIGLVLGGATKIKGYFLESAKLPEIRGASALLDRINLEDVPALFGRRNHEHDPQRAERFRKDFYERTEHALSAPECIIYAAGGNTLAFTPTSVVQKIADEIERIYTNETLVANSVAVGGKFDLLELQYGLNPTQFWVEDFHKACGDSETSELMESYYGGKKDNYFLKRKCFGELTTKLAQAQLHRREGNPAHDRTTRRDLPTHVEIGPYQKRCTSCERRPAIIPPESTFRVLCEACARKYVTGRASKKQLDPGELDHFTKPLKWSPANKGKEGEYLLNDWISLYNGYVKVLSDDPPKDEQVPDGPNDLTDIAKASDPENYIAFIYADGNNMGAYLENIATPAQYRQFSERVFIALQKAAFDALAKHLTPTDKNIHPFEIISIGGDDLILIVPGSAAFDVVHAIGENFDRQFDSQKEFTAVTPDNLRKSQRYKRKKWADKQRMQPAFSLSLGFVIAEEHTPIGFLEHLAHSLLKSAKTRAKTLKKKEIGYLGGTVDFLTLKSISMITSELSDFRKKFYKTETDNSLTMRPFTLYELSGFIKTIQAFKKDDFPRSQLYQLQQSLELGKATSTLDYLYFRSRLKEGKGKLLQKQIEHKWQAVSDDDDNNLGPWYAMLQKEGTDKKCYETLLLDLIEAYDFIPKPEGDNNEEDSSDESQS